jgi:hypothetical protein
VISDVDAGLGIRRHAADTRAAPGLIRGLLESGGLTTGQETREARELWTAVERETSRMRTPFDEEWLAGLLAMHESSKPAPSGTEPIEVLWWTIAVSVPSRRDPSFISLDGLRAVAGDRVHLGP